MARNTTRCNIVLILSFFVLHASLVRNELRRDLKILILKDLSKKMEAKPKSLKRMKTTEILRIPGIELTYKQQQNTMKKLVFYTNCIPVERLKGKRFPTSKGLKYERIVIRTKEAEYIENNPHFLPLHNSEPEINLSIIRYLLYNVMYAKPASLSLEVDIDVSDEWSMQRNQIESLQQEAETVGKPTAEPMDHSSDGEPTTEPTTKSNKAATLNMSKLEIYVNDFFPCNCIPGLQMLANILRFGKIESLNVYIGLDEVGILYDLIKCLDVCEISTLFVNYTANLLMLPNSLQCILRFGRIEDRPVHYFRESAVRKDPRITHKLIFHARTVYYFNETDRVSRVDGIESILPNWVLAAPTSYLSLPLSIYLNLNEHQRSSIRAKRIKISVSNNEVYYFREDILRMRGAKKRNILTKVLTISIQNTTLCTNTEDFSTVTILEHMIVWAAVTHPRTESISIRGTNFSVLSRERGPLSSIKNKKVVLLIGAPNVHVKSLLFETWNLMFCESVTYGKSAEKAKKLRMERSILVPREMLAEFADGSMQEAIEREYGMSKGSIPCLTPLGSRNRGSNRESTTETSAASSAEHTSFVKKIECPVCQIPFSEMPDSTLIYVLSRCSHVFCKSCMEEWGSSLSAAGSATCPFCRAEIINWNRCYRVERAGSEAKITTASSLEPAYAVYDYSIEHKNIEKHAEIWCIDVQKYMSPATAQSDAQA